MNMPERFALIIFENSLFLSFGEGVKKKLSV
jgi:hypothetical protein